eukprot:4934077-Pyramimonas_sp.AAC.1
MFRSDALSYAILLASYQHIPSSESEVALEHLEPVFAHAVRAAVGEGAMPQLWQNSVISAAA